MLRCYPARVLGSWLPRREKGRHLVWKIVLQPSQTESTIVGPGYGERRAAEESIRLAVHVETAVKLHSPSHVAAGCRVQAAKELGERPMTTSTQVQGLCRIVHWILRGRVIGPGYELVCLFSAYGVQIQSCVER